MSHKTILAFSFLTAVILLLAGCAGKNEPVEMIPIETLRSDYDFDEALAKFSGMSAGFPADIPLTRDNCLLYDLNGDGNDEMLTCSMRGSGMVHTALFAYDAYNDVLYEMNFYNMHDAYGYDYYILSVEDEGVIVAENHYYPEQYYPKYGYLILEDGRLDLEFFDQDSSEYEYADELYKERNTISIQL